MATILTCPFIREMPKVTTPMTTTVVKNTVKEAPSSTDSGKVVGGNKKTLVEKPQAD